MKNPKLRKLLEPHEKRSKQVKIMLTEKEFENFRDKAFRSHQSVAHVIRELAKGKEIKEAMTSEKAGLLRELARAGNNINQIAKSCRKDGVLAYADKIEAMMAFLEQKIYE